ncbi:putative ATP-grasp domain fused to redox center [Halapricum desulfuricans]|uniref:Putative ATP-grasp domain fused to redox center n=2 Tax=Halapricum desulfuricans TaxID=2841257 RepID=A0A897NIH3_9EURY|nr:putative ATP-grasp domain fused to redox center [Halapricum desulfuricans]
MDRPDMDANLQCAPCVLRQTLETAQQTDASDATRERALRRAAAAISEMSFAATPMHVAARAQSIVREETGDGDPFAEHKRVANETVEGLVPELRADLERADDPFEHGVRLAIAGNVIDVGPGHDVDIEATIEDVLEQPFAVDRLDELRADLATASDVLYLADNAGEIVLDRLLIERLDADVEVVVKDRPFLNDATAAEARAVGLGDVASVRTRGADGVGTVSERFDQRLREADVVISKGQGNYELFSDVDADVYFLFLVKCGVVADSVGAPEGSIVVA